MKEGKIIAGRGTVFYVYILKRSFTGIITPYSASESSPVPKISITA